MDEKPQTGLAPSAICAYPVVGRIRPEEILRRKIIRKMVARRERPAAASAQLVRRVG
jgi:hypothetical protein